MQQQKSFEPHDVGCLYLVPTPIGNLEDITMRAVRVLREVALIAAEDTRHTQKLLQHLSIQTPQISFHEHNVAKRLPQLQERLLAGDSIAQVSDAGMPSISDPGKELVASCVVAGIPVIALPGANAAVTALIASGLPPQPFYFYGFLPRKQSAQRALFEQWQTMNATIIIYESPQRLAKLLRHLSEVYPPAHPVVVCRELTKRYEEYTRGSLAEVCEWAATHPIKGELCVLLGPSYPPTHHLDTEWASLTVAEHVAQICSEGLSSKEAIKAVAQLRQMRKQDVYRLYHHNHVEEHQVSIEKAGD